jgi:hypothetical protein
LRLRERVFGVRRRVRGRDGAQAKPGETQKRTKHQRVARDDPHHVVLVGVGYGEEETGQKERAESAQTQKPVTGPRAGKARDPDEFE